MSLKSTAPASIQAQRQEHVAGHCSSSGVGEGFPGGKLRPIGHGTEKSTGAVWKEARHHESDEKTSRLSHDVASPSHRDRAIRGPATRPSEGGSAPPSAGTEERPTCSRLPDHQGGSRGLVSRKMDRAMRIPAAQAERGGVLPRRTREGSRAATAYPRVPQRQKPRPRATASRLGPSSSERERRAWRLPPTRHLRPRQLPGAPFPRADA